MKQIFLGFIMLFANLVNAWAQTPTEDLEIGKELMKQQLFDTAYIHLKASANHRNLEAMYLVGNMYRVGTGIEKDRSQAYYWLKRSADSSFPMSYEPLGIMYFEDKKKDSAKIYLEKAMEFTQSSAGVLGAIYVEEDRLEEALKLFKLGAKNGDPISMYHLGEMYYDGDVVEFNEKEAVRWMQRSAKKGYHPATAYLEDLGYEDLEDIDELESGKGKSKKKERKKKMKEEEEVEEDTEEKIEKKSKKSRKEKELEEEE